MKETPEYEKYPVSEEEMGKRYKNWTQSLARMMVILYTVGKETGGEKFIEKLKKTFHEDGQKGAGMWMSLTGTTKEDFKDCMCLPKIHDLIDDTFANYWDGYVEHTPRAFEKELRTCPIVKYWTKAPEICELLLGESLKGMVKELNPKFKTKGFSKILTKGDSVCRFRVEMDE
jgi:hypothetical protein